MKHWLILIPTLFSLSASPAFSDGQSPRQVVASRISQPPVIDGKLSEPSWAAAKEAAGFVLHETLDGRPSAATYVKVLTDGKDLFLGFRCIEPETSLIKAEPRDRDSQVWTDDCVEVILDPTNERQRLFHFIANAAGSRFDSSCVAADTERIAEDASWNGEWEVQTSVESGKWYAEIRIPLASIGASQDANPCLGVNFARERYAGKSELSAWSPTRREFANPACLGELILPGADGSYCLLEFPRLETLPIGRHLVDFRIVNHSKSEARIKFAYTLAGPKEACGDAEILSIKPGGRISKALPLNPDQPGSYRLTLELADVTGGKTLYKLSRNIQVLRAVTFNESLYALYHKRADARISVNMPASEVETAELRVSLLREGSDAPVSVKKIRPPFAREIQASFDMSRQKKGGYTILAELRQGDKVLAWCESRNMPYDPRPEIGFDDNGFLLVDGKPFFPVGIYTLQDKDNKDHDAILAEARKVGFNTTVYYALTPTAVLPLLDACARNGIKAFVYPVMPFSVRTGKETTADFIKDIEAKRDHPALLGWYLVDEPEGIGKGAVDAVRELYQMLKQMDTDHPCSLVIMGAKAAADYRACTDIMWIDPYPVPHAPVTYVSECTSGAVAAVERDKPVWVIPQAFDWNIWRTGKIDKVHRPTPEEERCMTYLALVHGAKGIIYWAHTASRYYIRDYPEHWAAVKKIAGELRDLSPVLLTLNSGRTLRITPGSATVDTMVKELDGQVYVFAVNRNPQECSATFRLSGTNSDSEVEVLFEDRVLKAADGCWKDDFRPLEVHVYRLPER